MDSDSVSGMTAGKCSVLLRNTRFDSGYKFCVRFRSTGRSSHILREGGRSTADSEEEEEEEKEEEEDEESGHEDSVSPLLVPVQLLLMVSLQFSPHCVEPLVSGSLLMGVLASSEKYRIWILLGDDFWGRFRIHNFLRSTVDTVRLFGGFRDLSEVISLGSASKLEGAKYVE